MRQTYQALGLLCSRVPRCTIRMCNRSFRKGWPNRKKNSLEISLVHPGTQNRVQERSREPLAAPKSLHGTQVVSQGTDGSNVYQNAQFFQRPCSPSANLDSWHSSMLECNGTCEIIVQRRRWGTSKEWKRKSTAYVYACMCISWGQ